MAARRDRSGLTAKESKIVSKKSRLFDSKTQGIGLPQKSSKATITGRKPGKPKPTSGKGINKNVVTKSGKAGRAIENKMRSAMNLPKLQTTGKTKVTSRVRNINEVADYRTGGAFAYEYKKGKLKEIVENAGSKKVKPRNLNKVLKKMAPSNKKEVKKYKETKTAGGPYKISKVPVKPKGGRGLRGGGMLGGGGGMSRTNR